MSDWLDLAQLGLSPNQKHQALLGAPKIVHCGLPSCGANTDRDYIFEMERHGRFGTAALTHQNSKSFLDS